jgi:Tfp pilus assembly protein FimV
MADRKRTVAELEQRRQDLMAEMRELAEEINQRAGEEDGAFRSKRTTK